MKKTRKKLLSILLATVVLLTMLPVGGLTAFAVTNGIQINEETFPDENFRAYVSEKFDTDLNGYLSDEEIAAVTSVSAANNNISDLTGIGYFTALTSLSCGSNNLTELDVSKNAALTWLYCGRNKLTELDVSANAKLDHLACYNNLLTSLDISANPEISNVDCSGNLLTSIKINDDNKITDFVCYGNRLVLLDANLPRIGWYEPLYLGNPFSRQTSVLENATPGDGWTVDMADIVGAENLSKVTAFANQNWDYNPETGIGVYVGEGQPLTFRYSYSGVRRYERLLEVTLVRELYTGELLPVDETIFPDVNFRAYIAENLDTDTDGYLSKEEINAAVEIDVNNSGISSLSGIEYFTALEKLNCNDNQLASLDVSRNGALRELSCSGNMLTVLSVNIGLRSLLCADNALESLYLRENEYLNKLDCTYNKLTDIAFYKGNQVNSYNFDISFNRLTALPELPWPYYSATVLCRAEGQQASAELVDTDGVYSVELKGLVSSLKNIEVTGSGEVWNYDSASGIATYIGAGKPTSLTYVYHDSKLTESGMDVTLTFAQAVSEGLCIAEAFPDENFREYVSEKFDTDLNGYLSDEEIAAVTSVDVSSKNITDLTGIGHFANLKKLYCTFNKLKVLDLSCNVNLEELSCIGSSVEEINLSNCTKLRRLVIWDNHLSELDITDCAALENLVCSYNRLKVLDTTNNPELISLDCSDNYIEKLDVSKNPKLELLYCGIMEIRGNFLTELDVTNNTALRILECDSNKLTEIDVSHNPLLDTLNCGANMITEIDVSHNPVLKQFICNNNKLTEIDVSNNPLLYNLNFRHNAIKEIDVSNNPQLNMLYCNDCELTELDLSNITKISWFGCDKNHLTKLDLPVEPVNYIDDYYQTVQTQLKSTQGKLNVDFAALVGAENLAKVQISDESWQYNAETGEAVYLGEDMPEMLVYYYSGDCLPKPLEVRLTLTAPEADKGLCIAEAFPDEKFRAYIVENFDVDSDGYLAGEEIAAVTALNLSNKGISDLTGIEFFTSLTTLYCNNNSLTVLDLKQTPNFAYVINQNSAAKIKNVDGKQVVDLSAVVGSENLAKVMLEPGQNWDYDSATGIAIYLGMGVPEKLSYIYQGDNLLGGMNVTLTLTAEKPPKYVVMKKERVSAYVDGELQPTTDYGAGKFAKAISKPDGYVLPLRYIGEQFGFAVEYLGDGRTKVVNAAGEYIVVNRDNVEIGKYDAADNLIETFTVAIAPFTEDGITYVPLRAVSEALGLGVSYVGSGTTGHGSYVVVSTDLFLNLKPDYVLAEIEKAYALGL